MTTVRDPSAWIVTAVGPVDRSTWRELYRGYGSFYEVDMPPEKLDLIWSWLHDPDEPLWGLVVRADVAAAAVGLVHYRPFHRPLHGSIGCYLDDLFVAPSARGSGAVDALLGALQRIAGENCWDVVRWVTRSSNARARSTYHRLATETDLVTYDLAPLRPGS
ncbi:MAG: GNAT family N-acetyltransferase [Jatrophihabitans sp.]